MMTLNNHPQNMSPLSRGPGFHLCFLNSALVTISLCNGLLEPPVLICVNVTPLRPSHMRKLFELATTPTKIWKPLPGGDHNSSVLEEGYFEAVSDFVTNVAIDEKS